MFWWAAAVGLKTLTYWETYAAVVEYFAIFFIGYRAAALLLKKRSGTRAATGNFVLLIPVLHAAAIQIFVLTLSPILFGMAGDAAWGYPLELLTTSPKFFFAMLGVLMTAAGIMAVIPFLRRCPAVHALVLGSIALMFAFGIIISDNPGMLKAPMAIIPDVWFLAGLLVICGVVTWAGRRAASLAGKALGVSENGPGLIILFPLSAVLGFLPVFMYGALLGIQLKGGM
jgi:hypothetical protein